MLRDDRATEDCDYKAAWLPGLESFCSTATAHLFLPSLPPSYTMVQVREVINSYPTEETDSEYEDISDSELSETASPRGRHWKLLPSWLRIRSGTSLWSLKLYDRIGMLLKKAGSLVWIFTTSMLLVGLPVLFAYDREKALQEQQLGGLPAPLSAN